MPRSPEEDWLEPSKTENEEVTEAKVDASEKTDLTFCRIRASDEFRANPIGQNWLTLWALGTECRLKRKGFW